MPSEQYADEILGDYFLLFKPKDVVSGDFYWFSHKNDYLLLCVADCTGHGVPGGFMSMLGMSFLNEIVSKEDIHSASQVLDELRKYVIVSLQQHGVSGEQKDGMDLSFIAINKSNLQMQYAGANNSLYYYRKESNELIEIKPDKMPVAIHDHMEPFTNHHIQLEPGDVVYLSTDGFQDQFGGPENRKFMRKNFTKMINENTSLPLKDQKDNMEKVLSNWKEMAKQEQTDDITILGIRI